MKRINYLIAISAFSLAVLALPGIASAQWYPNSGGPYGQGQNRDLRPVARNLKDRSRDFERQVDRSLRDRRWNQRNYYSGDISRLATDFRKAADRFQSRYGNGRNLNNSAGAARDLLNAASRLENAIQNSGMNNQLMRHWAPMRRDLNLVANTYGYNYNRNQNNRNNRNADWRNRVPFPLPF